MSPRRRQRMAFLGLFAIAGALASGEEPLFLFQGYHEAITSYDSEGEPLYGEALRPKGFAHTDRVGRLQVSQGAYIANYVGEHIRTSVQNSGEFSLQLVFTAGLAGQSGALLSFGNDKQSYWSVSQWAGDLRFEVGGANPRIYRLLMIPESTTIIVTLVYQDGQLTCYRDDHRETEPSNALVHPASWVEPTLVLGDTIAGGADWSGSIDRIAIYDYALTLSDIHEHLATYRKRTGQRTAVPWLKLQTRLTAKSTIPTVEQLAPYTQSLAVFKYSVEEVLEGSYAAPTVNVVHWTILDGTPLAHNDVKLGDEVVLLLEEFQDHEYLHSENLSDTVVEDFTLPLYFDAGQHALGGRAALSTFRVRTLRDYTIDPEIAWADTAPLSAADHDARHERIIQDRALLEKRRRSLGDWSNAQKNLSSFHQDIRTRIETASEAHRNEYTGENGYIFTKTGSEFLLEQDLLNVPGSDGISQIAASAATIIDLSKQLLGKGIHLIVVPVPNSEQVYPDYISTEIPDGIPASPANQELIEYLLQAGVEVIDLLPVFEKARTENDCHLYLRTDGHWSSCGIQLAASELYERFERYGFIRSMGQPSYYTTRDIVVKLPLASLAQRLPEPERDKYRDIPWKVQQIFQRDGTGYQDDPDSPILVIGDSYTLQFYKQYGHLSAQLSQRIGGPVASYMSYASGPQVPRVLARLGKEFVEKRKVIVWVFSGSKVNPAMYDEWISVQLP